MNAQSAPAASRPATKSKSTGEVVSPASLPTHPKARAIYEFLVQHAKTHKLPPTRQEIADGANIASTGTVQRWLLKLETQGFITVDSGTARGIFVNAAPNGPGRNQG
jgi:SOS-response transcriptional repressor LexA